MSNLENTVALTEDQVFSVRKLTDKPLNYAKESIPGKNGETYHRFRCQGIVFTVNSNDPFVTSFEKGELNKIFLQRTQIIDSETGEVRKGFELDYFVTNTQALGVAEFKAKVNALTNLSAPVSTKQDYEELA